MHWAYLFLFTVLILQCRTEILTLSHVVQLVTLVFLLHSADKSNVEQAISFCTDHITSNWVESSGLKTLAEEHPVTLWTGYIELQWTQQCTLVIHRKQWTTWRDERLSTSAMANITFRRGVPETNLHSVSSMQSLSRKLLPDKCRHWGASPREDIIWRIKSKPVMRITVSTVQTLHNNSKRNCYGRSHSHTCRFVTGSTRCCSQLEMQKYTREGKSRTDSTPRVQRRQTPAPSIQLVRLPFPQPYHETNTLKYSESRISKFVL
jgi:hypothetical protein